MEQTPEQLKKSEVNKAYYNANKEKWSNINDKQNAKPKQAEAAPVPAPSCATPPPPTTPPGPSKERIVIDALIERLALLKAERDTLRDQLDDYKKVLLPFINMLNK
tara:strand:- start:2301 stop:2618 length:318 start_codon:yes stop_codon:yes gene_type:complete